PPEPGDTMTPPTNPLTHWRRLDEARRLTLAIVGCLAFALVLAALVWVEAGRYSDEAAAETDRARQWEVQRARVEALAGGPAASIDDLVRGFDVAPLADDPRAGELADRAVALASGAATTDTWETLAADVAAEAEAAGSAVPAERGAFVVRLRAGAVVASAVFVAAVWLLIVPLIGSISRTRRRLETARREELTRNRVRDLASRVAEGLDVAETEEEARAVVSRALDRMSSRPVEVLLADSSRAHLERAVTHPRLGGPGCDVSSPWGCPAVRRARTMIYARSDDLDACPHLDQRPDGACSAVCVPLTFLGDALGVLHQVGPVAEPPDPVEVETLETIASETAVRLGTMRKIARIELQARLDPVTGLPNLRATREELARVLLEPGDAIVALIAPEDFGELVAAGDAAVDRALRLMANAVNEVAFDAFAGRLRGGQVVIVWRGVDPHLARSRCRALAASLAGDSARTGREVTVAWAVVRAGGHDDVDALVAHLHDRLGRDTRREQGAGRAEDADDADQRYPAAGHATTDTAPAGAEATGGRSGAG
ncbi:MAG: hypothetical protein D6683_16105, partial [Actinomyces sp.]